MKPNFYNLVIVSPGDSRILKFHISRRVIMIMIVAFLLSFLITVAVGYIISSRKELNSEEHLRLQTENQTLEVEIKNAAIRNQKLEAQLENLEKLSERVSTLMESDWKLFLPEPDAATGIFQAERQMLFEEVLVKVNQIVRKQFDFKSGIEL